MIIPPKIPIDSMKIETSEFLSHYEDDEFQMYASFPNVIFVNQTLFEKIRKACEGKELFDLIKTLKRRPAMDPAEFEQAGGKIIHDQ